MACSEVRKSRAGDQGSALGHGELNRVASSSPLLCCPNPDGRPGQMSSYWLSTPLSRSVTKVAHRRRSSISSLAIKREVVGSRVGDGVEDDHARHRHRSDVGVLAPADHASWCLRARTALCAARVLRVGGPLNRVTRAAPRPTECDPPPTPMTPEARGHKARPDRALGASPS